jgi:uncharacterized protein YndB with AHSA1/START domain
VSSQQPPGVVVVERRVAASPETVFGFFADPACWLQWQGIEAELDPRPGGRFRMNVRGDGWASGRFVEVDPPRRIVFTWGWEIERSPLAPGSSRVEVELIPEDGGTLVRLTHRDLPPEEAANHQAGWTHYLDRLAVRATGGDPGPDPARVDL